MNYDIETLTKIATEFREALQLEISSRPFVVNELKNFPSGSCDFASKLLSLYLSSIGLSDVKLVFAARPNPEDGSDYRSQCHVWILVGEKIIMDVTGSQFNDCFTDVIVSENSEFHSTFSAHERRDVIKNDPDWIGEGDENRFFSRLMLRLGVVA